MTNRRLPAEWEKQSAVQITFPHQNSDWQPFLEEVTQCFIKIATEISKRQLLLVVCDSIARVKNILTGHVQLKNVIFYEIESNDTWARDHAGITLIEDEQPVMLDFTFNGWGEKFDATLDNLITKKLHEKNAFGNIQLQTIPFVLEGGSIESDGKGTILTTADCMLSPKRNPQFSKEQITEKLKEFFGAERILWLNNGGLFGDDTDSHIDTLARFCDENTIAYVQCLDTNDEHWAELLVMETELKQLKNAQNKPYKLVPLPFPDAHYGRNEEGEKYRLPATYANFLIINEAVLVPVYNVPQDETALSTLKKCFPKREIVPIDCTALIKQHGSLHCVTMQYPEGVIKNKLDE